MSQPNQSEVGIGGGPQVFLPVPALTTPTVCYYTSESFNRVPRVRLKVWYYSPTGRCIQLNKELAELLSRKNLGDWRAQPNLVQPSTMKHSKSEDNYVCFEVDFEHRYRNPKPRRRNPPDDTLRELFRLRLPSIIDGFFTDVFRPDVVKPLHVTMAPQEVGGNLSLEERDKYTMTPHIWQPFMIKSTTDVRAAARPGHPGHNTALHVASVSMAASIFANSILEYVTVIPNRLMCGHSMSSVFDDAAGFSQRAVDELLDDNNNDSLAMTPEIREAWVKASVSSASFQELVKDIQSCASNIKEQAATNQTLYRMVCQMASARVLFTQYQKMMSEFNMLVKARTKADSKCAKTKLLHSLVVLVGSVALLFAGPGVIGVGGLAAAIKIGSTVAAVGSGVKAGSNVNYKWDLEGKMKVVAKLDRMVPPLYDRLRTAQVSFAALFCQQVLGVPLENMARETQKSVLTELGVDATQLSEKVYTKEIVLTAIERMVKFHSDFATKRAEVASECGLQQDIINAEFKSLQGIGDSSGSMGMVEPSSPTVEVRA